MSLKIPRKNEEITAKEVRVVGSAGEMLGIMPTREAVFKAKSEGLDLLEVSPNVEPPVCKILDFGKYRYDVKKKKLMPNTSNTKLNKKKLK